MCYEPMKRLREELQPLLPERCFLRRARTDALFATNARLPAGNDRWRIEPAGPIALLTPGDALLTALIDGVPERDDHLSRSLLGTRGYPRTALTDRCLLHGLKLTEHCTPEALDTYEREVRRAAALTLRTHTGSAYACACLLNTLKTKGGAHP